MPQHKKKSLNILMADDSAEIAAAASYALQSSGHAVDVAKDGLEALIKITEKPHHYDLLITDNNMPNLSGVQLIDQIRKDGFSGKVIVASGLITEEMSKFYESLNVTRIVPKPYNISELCKVVESLDIQQEN